MKILTQNQPSKKPEAAHDWEYSEDAQFLYGMAVLFKDRFLDPILLTDRGRLPNPVISFDDLRNKKTLAAYTLHRNPQGLLDEITFNTTHYTNEDGKRSGYGASGHNLRCFFTNKYICGNKILGNIL